MSIESGDSMKFGFNKPNANNNEQDVNSTPVEEEVVNSASTSIADSEDDTDLEYTDRKFITINLVKTYSLYRRVNDKVLPKRQDYIGSCVKSSRMLSANKGEVEAYFPNIVGLSPNDKDFVMRVKQYLNNIRIPIDELGRKFDISFHYYHKKDYLRFKREEDEIEAVYQATPKQSIKQLREALNEKITKINILESTKYKFGYPINVDDYIVYRHCLFYHDVAKDISLINSDNNIRFYFKDDQKESEKLRKYRIEVNSAKSNYVTCCSDDNIFDAIYIQYCVLNGYPVISSMNKTRLDKEIELDKFSSNEPVKFNKIFKNKDLKLIGTIEMLIARGELIRSQYNQNISTPEGEFIGANMTEAITYFKNPDNTSIVTAFYNKLKNI